MSYRTKVQASANSAAPQKALQARNRSTASAGIGGKEQGIVNSRYISLY